MSVKCVSLTFILIVLFINNTYGSDNYCFSTDPVKPQLSNFGSETAYSRVSGSSDQNYELEGCKRVKLWSLNRHGTKNPNNQTLENFKLLTNIQKEIINGQSKGSLCNSDYQRLKNWAPPNINPRYAGYLVEQGRKDLSGIAQAYNKLFPDLVTRQYNPEKYKFAVANKYRVYESYVAYVTELFGEENVKSITVQQDRESDEMLQPMNYCGADAKAIMDYNSQEEFKFNHSKLYEQLRVNISHRLGLPRQLENKEIRAMWSMCIFEAAWNLIELPTWCAAFLQSEANILEYDTDLYFYYAAGPGLKKNFLVPYLAISDMLNKLSTNDLPNVINYFTREQSIHFFLDGIGAFLKGLPLTATNFHQQKYRQFQSSKMTPFAANFVAVKYECTNGDDQVLLLLNEKPLDLGWCRGYCSWPQLQEKLNFYTDSDFKRNCKISKKEKRKLKAKRVLRKFKHKKNHPK